MTNTPLSKSQFRLIEASDAGRKAFYLIQLTKTKIAEFERDLTAGEMLGLNYYGIVIDSIYADTMPVSLELKYEQLVKTAI